MPYWKVEKVEDWAERGPSLLVHDYCGSIAIPTAELEEFVVQVGEVVAQLGYFDASDLLQFIIRSVREKAAALDDASEG